MADGRRTRFVPVLGVLVLALSAIHSAAQAPAPGTELSVHIANLASLDYPTRMNAARLIRREPAAQAVAALKDAVASSRDEFVRYRAFVLLSSFNDRGMSDLARGLLRDRNDRLRESAYKWLEAHPDAGLAAALLPALQTEVAEFVRPALIGALAAVADDPQVQKALIAETGRGVDFFRSAVIDALGRHRAAYAVDAITAVSRIEGPLQDDAVLALGRIGGARARAALQEIQKPTVDASIALHAAQCLVGNPCAPSLETLVDAASAPGASIPRLRTTMGAIAAVAAGGNDAATQALLGLGAGKGAVRDQAALGLAIVAVRNPEHIISWLEAAPPDRRTAMIGLLRDGFEDLEEDFGEEQFFATVRASYWKAPEGSASRTLAATIIDKLEF